MEGFFRPNFHQKTNHRTDHKNFKQHYKSCITIAVCIPELCQETKLTTNSIDQKRFAIFLVSLASDFKRSENWGFSPSKVVEATSQA